MSKFKIGDIVKVNRWDSGDSNSLHGHIGKIIEINSSHRSDLGREVNYYILDVARWRFGDDATGIWEYELTLVNSVKKEIKQFGIVKFLESIERKI